MIYRAAAVLISSELTELEDGDTNVESFTPEYNADNLTKLTTYRATGKVISTDPSGLKVDTTTWEYDLATGLELRKTYADGKGTVKTYDAYNNLATVTDARGVVATYTYNLNRGLLTSINFSDGTPAQKFTYNFLGQLTAVQDASGARSISYGRYGSQLEEVQQIASSRFLLQEQRDAYGRGTGYILKRNGNRQCAASITYGTLGRIALAGFIHAGEEHQFRYGYLAGSNLLQSLAMPNGVTLTQSYEEKRDLLTGMDYVRDNSLITQRQYNYDALGRPVTRDTRYPNKAIHHNDTFAYNKRSELTGALLDENAYTYAYDNIGNREIAQEVTEGITYAANDLNQYTRISTNGENFTPEYDADGNQTLIQTSTGIWKVQYNGQNRAIRFESEDGHTVITCGYDYMGRRFEKKVVTNGTTTLHERYIYRGYLQIAAYDLREGHAEHPDLRFIFWDPTQEVATRPLAIRENGVWYTYGWDLTKNICELYGQEGFIRTIYTYSPYRQVAAEGDVTQPIQWSSEMYDAELGIVYYNFRYYNPLDGRWTRRDPMSISASLNPYTYVNNRIDIDSLGLSPIPRHTSITSITVKRKRIKWISIIRKDLLKSSKTKPGERDTYGHWWIEFGDESYGWWPKYGVSSLEETVFGVEGQLNGMGDNPNPTRDADHGGQADYQFNPMLYVGNVSSTYMQYGTGRGKECTCVNEEEIKDCLRTFARSYTGTWSYPFGQNCHSFQTEMMDMCCLRAPRF